MARTVRWLDDREQAAWRGLVALHRMSARGLVRREECATNARGAFAGLTTADQTAIDTAAPLHADHVRAWFVDALTPTQLDAMAAISASVIDRLTRHQADDVPGKATTS